MSPDSVQASSETQRQLLRMVNGCTKTVAPLIKASMAKHPNRSEQWHFEKVIGDLKTGFNGWMLITKANPTSNLEDSPTVSQQRPPAVPSKHRLERINTPVSPPKPLNLPIRKPVSLQPVPKSLEKQLLSMVSGNRGLALRLVESVKVKNPDRSDTWCWEKAISDLERDRRL
ncbi:hypothetical protein [Leptolyngbya sp. FACHB-261]|uniref:hypothetical protein n=1 Tax=Leptolyngbya sp. FACHB-261 TaxID=2692806 RepID=UPI0016883F68|nr:hypothetical protein [Leptolyngbya sp. FACHB-261]MBD2101788.1 hypothetical protein [Leptolyngbya sp. FACHB-261]